MHPSSLVHTTDIGAETKIVHIRRKSHNECTVITMKGNRSQKASWDSGAPYLMTAITAPTLNIEMHYSQVVWELGLQMEPLLPTKENVT